MIFTEVPNGLLVTPVLDVGQLLMTTSSSDKLTGSTVERIYNVVNTKKSYSLRTFTFWKHTLNRETHHLGTIQDTESKLDMNS